MKFLHPTSLLPARRGGRVSFGERICFLRPLVDGQWGTTAVMFFGDCIAGHDTGKHSVRWVKHGPKQRSPPRMRLAQTPAAWA